MTFLAKDNLHSRHEVLDKEKLSCMEISRFATPMFYSYMKVFIYPYDRIRQFFQKCFLLVPSLVDIQQINQELDGSTLKNLI